MRESSNASFSPLFSQDDTEDTSTDHNPLYSRRAQNNVLFGRGYIGGVDKREQRKQNGGFMESLTKRRHQSDMDSAGNSEDRKALEQEHQEAQEKKRRKEIRSDAAYAARLQAMKGLHWSDKELEDMQERDWKILREDFEINIKKGRPLNPVRKWEEAGLNPEILMAITKMGYVWLCVCVCVCVCVRTLRGIVCVMYVYVLTNTNAIPSPHPPPAFLLPILPGQPGTRSRRQFRCRASPSASNSATSSGSPRRVVARPPPLSSPSSCTSARSHPRRSRTVPRMGRWR